MVFDYQISDTVLTLFAPFADVQYRGQTLNLPLVQVSILEILDFFNGRSGRRKTSLMKQTLKLILLPFGKFSSHQHGEALFKSELAVRCRIIQLELKFSSHTAETHRPQSINRKLGRHLDAHPLRKYSAPRVKPCCMCVAGSFLL